MAKYVKTSKAVIGSLIAILAVGAAVGVLGAVSQGFNGNVMESWFQTKYDYTKINLENKHDKETLDPENALKTLNYGLKDDVFASVDTVANAYLSEGGLLLDGNETNAQLVTTFTEGLSFTHIAITGHQYYVENYLDEDGEEVRDDDDELVLQSYICDNSKLVVNELDPVRYVTNSSNDKKTPKIETKKFEFEEGQTSLSLDVSEGAFVVTSIELWNIEDVEDEKETTSSETKTSE